MQRWSGLGQAAAMLAVLCQILGLLTPMPGAAAAQLSADLGVICHTEGRAAVPDGKQVPASDACHLCPACLASLPSIVPAPPALPTTAVRDVAVALTRNLPGRVAVAERSPIQPRAPPASV